MDAAPGRESTVAGSAGVCRGEGVGVGLLGHGGTEGHSRRRQQCGTAAQARRGAGEHAWGQMGGSVRRGVVGEGLAAGRAKVVPGLSDSSKAQAKTHKHHRCSELLPAKVVFALGCRPRPRLQPAMFCTVTHILFRVCRPLAAPAAPTARLTARQDGVVQHEEFHLGGMLN